MNRPNTFGYRLFNPFEFSQIAIVNYRASNCSGYRHVPIGSSNSSINRVNLRRSNALTATRWQQPAARGNREWTASELAERKFQLNFKIWKCTTLNEAYSVTLWRLQSNCCHQFLRILVVAKAKRPYEKFELRISKFCITNGLYKRSIRTMFTNGVFTNGICTNGVYAPISRTALETVKEKFWFSKITPKHNFLWFLWQKDKL